MSERTLKGILLNPFSVHDLDVGRLVRDKEYVNSDEFEAIIQGLCRPVTIENFTYRSIYPLLTTPFKEVRTFDCVRLDKDNDLYVDDEGLHGDIHGGIRIRGYPQPLVGKGLILSHDDVGESQSVTLGMKWIRDNVKLGLHNLEITLGPGGALLSGLNHHVMRLWDFEIQHDIWQSTDDVKKEVSEMIRGGGTMH